MKRILIILVLVFGVSCGDSNKDFGNFMDTYKEILMVRESVLDSSIANAKVREIIIKHGYELENFKNEFFELAKNNPQFSIILDSMRREFKQEINTIKDSIKLANKKAKADSATNSNE